MAEKKSNHFVPRFLMKQFANPDGYVNIFLINKKQPRFIKSVPYLNQNQYDYYYGKNKDWEDKLGEIEKKTAPIFKKITDNKNYYPLKYEINIIKQYILSQRFRVPTIIKAQVENIIELAKKSFEFYCLNKYRLPPTEKEYEALYNHEKDKAENSARDILKKLCFSYNNKIKDLELIVVHFDCSSKLILSDNPVLLFNPFMNDSSLVNVGLVMILPIGEATAIVLRDKVIFEKVPRIMVSKRDKAVDYINKMSLSVADEKVLTPISINEEYIRKMFIDSSIIRNKYYGSGSVSNMGTLGRDIVMIRIAHLEVNYPFMFSSIKKEYRKWKRYDLMVPRVEDKHYIERLNTLLPFTFDKVQDNYNVRKRKEQFENYKSFIYSYWNENK